VRVVEQELAAIAARLGGRPDAPVDQHPEVLAADAESNKAALDVSNRMVFAPRDGVVSHLPRVGDYVKNGTPVLALVAAAIATAAPVGGTVTALAGSGAAALPSDITTLVYSLKDEYADGAKFLMKKATEGLYRALTGSGFQFAPTPGAAQGEFWGWRCCATRTARRGASC
jgi:hypothetical protein